MMVDGQLEESASYGAVYDRVDEAVLIHAMSLKKASPRLRNYDLSDVWIEADRRSTNRFDPKNLFAFNLLFRNLHTPRNIQITNPHLPDIYTNCKCGLCNRSWGNEFHILCSCRHTKTIRVMAFEGWEYKVGKLLEVDMEGHGENLFDMLFPLSVTDFKFGRVPIQVKEYLRDVVGSRKAEYSGKRIGEFTRDMYYDIWDKYGTMIAERKVTFADRLMLKYGWTVKQLKKEAPRLKSEYRARVRAEREERRLREEGIGMAEQVEPEQLVVINILDGQGGEEEDEGGGNVRDNEDDGVMEGDVDDFEN